MLIAALYQFFCVQHHFWSIPLVSYLPLMFTLLDISGFSPTSSLLIQNSVFTCSIFSSRLDSATGFMIYNITSLTPELCTLPFSSDLATTVELLWLAPFSNHFISILSSLLPTYHLVVLGWLVKKFSAYSHITVQTSFLYSFWKNIIFL